MRPSCVEPAVCLTDKICAVPVSAGPLILGSLSLQAMTPTVPKMAIMMTIEITTRGSIGKR